MILMIIILKVPLINKKNEVNFCLQALNIVFALL